MRKARIHAILTVYADFTEYLSISDDSGTFWACFALCSGILFIQGATTRKRAPHRENDGLNMIFIQAHTAGAQQGYNSSLRHSLQASHSYAMALVAALLLLLSTTAQARTTEQTQALQSLTAERAVLTTELDQYRKTLQVLQTDDAPPELSGNPAVRMLAAESVALKERLVAIAEKEVALLQDLILEARLEAEKTAREKAVIEDKAYIQGALAKLHARNEASALAMENVSTKSVAMESKALRSHTLDGALRKEEEQVERLHQLLESYYADLAEAAMSLPTPQELTKRELAEREALTLAKVPFSIDKVRLTGAEGSTALMHITQRLRDPNLSESRRDIALICSVKTRSNGRLIASGNRSLLPVGKNNYLFKIRLKAGDTTLSILDRRWNVRLPEGADKGEFLITFYRPAGSAPELHVFAVQELLAQKDAHLPAWLPESLNLNLDGVHHADTQSDTTNVNSDAG